MGVTPGQYASGFVQGSGSESGSSEWNCLTPDTGIDMSESGTPRLEGLDGNGTGVLNLEAGESLLSVLWPVGGLSVVEGEPPVTLDDLWNDFDAFLAAEPGQHLISSMEDPPLAIDPQMIVASGI